MIKPNGTHPHGPGYGRMPPFLYSGCNVCMCVFSQGAGASQCAATFFVCMLQLLEPDETGMTCKNRHGTRMPLSLLSAILQYHVCFFFCPPFPCLLKVLIRKNKKKNIQHFNWTWQAKLVQILIHPLKWNSKRCTVTPVFYFTHLNK